MPTDSIRQQLISSLKKKANRKPFLLESIRVGIAYQIRANRESRKWSQDELGKKAQKPQATISRLEDPNKEGMTLNTLVDLASAFDFGLIVRFAPFSEIVGYEASIPDSSPVVPSFDDDKDLADQPKQRYAQSFFLDFRNWKTADLKGLLSKDSFSVNFDKLLETALVEVSQEEGSNVSTGVWTSPVTTVPFGSLEVHNIPVATHTTTDVESHK
jgi:transcriptional regulator with XRE-family HTH domain